MNDIQKLRYWTFKILPLVYDDSLSYYEVLAKVTSKINELVEYDNTLNDNIQQTTTDIVKEQLDSDGLATKIFNSLAGAIATDEGDYQWTHENKTGGELIWLNGTLYKVIKAMTTGDAYSVGSNIEEVKISDELANVKKYLTGTKNEYWRTQSANAYDTGVYLFWKDALYKTTKDIAVETLLADNGEYQNLEAVDLASEITKHYEEMHDADTNLQTQIDNNENDIETKVANANLNITNLQNQNTAQANQIADIQNTGTDAYTPHTNISTFATLQGTSGATQGACYNADDDILYVGKIVGTNATRIYAFPNLSNGGTLTSNAYVDLSENTHCNGMYYYDGVIYAIDTRSSTYANQITRVMANTMTQLDSVKLPFPEISHSEGLSDIIVLPYGSTDMICIIGTITSGSQYVKLYATYDSSTKDIAFLHCAEYFTLPQFVNYRQSAVYDPTSGCKITLFSSGVSSWRLASYVTAGTINQNAQQPYTAIGTKQEIESGFVRNRHLYIIYGNTVADCGLVKDYVVLNQGAGAITAAPRGAVCNYHFLQIDKSVLPNTTGEYLIPNSSMIKPYNMRKYSHSGYFGVKLNWANHSDVYMTAPIYAEGLQISDTQANINLYAQIRVPIYINSAYHNIVFSMITVQNGGVKIKGNYDHTTAIADCDFLDTFDIIIAN